MNQKIKIELTPEQIKQLQPLFDEVEKNPMTGAIIGQAWESKYFGSNYYAVFQFVTPKEMHEITNKAVQAAKDKSIKPARW